MNFNLNLVLWCLLVITKHCLTEEESQCVQRRLGACKTMTWGQVMHIDEFYNPQPDTFRLKTSMEINLEENKRSFEKYVLVEKKIPVRYNWDKDNEVTIVIRLNIGYIEIYLGMKYYRLAKIVFKRDWSDPVAKYNRYTPILPTFPYFLHLEMTLNGTFSVYADGNTEPFLEYRVTETFEFKNMYLDTYNNNTIAFVDCSMEYKYCYFPRVDRLYGCREWVVKKHSEIVNFDELGLGLQKTYGENVIFDEFIVFVVEYGSVMEFTFEEHVLTIGFSVIGVNSIWAKLEKHLTNWREIKKIKSVEIDQWNNEIPEHPYAVRVLLTSGENNNFLNITNLRNNTIVSMNLCEDLGSLRTLWITRPKLYFDCSFDDNIALSERPRKIIGGTDIEYHKNGYNFTKTFKDTSDFVSKPFTMYRYDFGNSTQDWCPGEPKPEVLVTWKYKVDSLNGIIERSNTVLHSDLQNITDTNAAVLAELKKVSTITDTNAAVLAELKKVSTIADTNAAVLAELKVISNKLATHLERNITTVRNYYNQLNVTEFLKIIKQT